MTKLIIFDLDGTLLTSDKRLSPGNRAALERAAGQGAAGMESPELAQKYMGKSPLSPPPRLKPSIAVPLNISAATA